MKITKELLEKLSNVTGVMIEDNQAEEISRIIKEHEDSLKKENIKKIEDKNKVMKKDGFKYDNIYTQKGSLKEFKFDDFKR